MNNFFEIESISDFSAKVKTKVPQVKKMFCDSTRGKDRSRYDINKYIEQLLLDTCVPDLQKVAPRRIVSATVEMANQIDLLSSAETLDTTIRWELAPSVPDFDLSTLHIKQISLDTPTQELDRVRDSLLLKYGSWQSAEGAIRRGDRLETVWETGDGGTEEQLVEIGVQPRLPEELENKIIGAQVGETVAHEMAIPDMMKNMALPPKYVREIARLSGKNIKINITIKAAYRLQPASIDQLVEQKVFESSDSFEIYLKSLFDNWLTSSNIQYAIEQMRDFISTDDFEVPASFANEMSSHLEASYKIEGQSILESVNSILKTGYTSEDEVKSEFALVAQRILRGTYSMDMLKSKINLDDQKLGQALIQYAISQPTKNIRQSLAQNREAWTEEIILRSAVDFCKENFVTQHVSWESVKDRVFNSSKYERYFSQYNLPDIDPKQSTHLKEHSVGAKSKSPTVKKTKKLDTE